MSRVGIAKAAVEQAVNGYLRQTLGEAYGVGKGSQMPNGDWRFLILFHGCISGSGRVLLVAGQRAGDGRKAAGQTGLLLAHPRHVAQNLQCKLPLLGGYVPRVFARH